MGKEEFEFVNEEVAPQNRWAKRKKKWLLAGTVIGLAVLFGVIARISYGISDRILESLLTDSDRETVELKPTPTVATSVGESNVTKPIEVDQDAFAQYELLMQGVYETAEAMKPCQVQIAAMKQVEDSIFSDVTETEKNSLGVILADNQIEFLVLAQYTDVADQKYETLQVTFANGVKQEALLVGGNEELNLAILKVSHQNYTDVQLAGISVISLGDSSKLQLGAVVVALGMPNGHDSSVDIGIISAKPRMRYIKDLAVSILQTNMQYFEGAGGILVNSKGELVGVLCQSLTPDASNLCALGINEITALLEYMINNVSHASFGAVLSDLTDEELAAVVQKNGIVILEMEEDSTAFQSGFRKGDVLTEIEGQKITSVSNFFTQLNSFKENESATITFYRNGKKHEKVIKITYTK